MFNRFTFIILLAATFSTSAQQSNFETRLARTAANITGALSSVVEWYDLPIGLSYLYRDHINNQLIIKPSTFEQNFANRNGLKGRFSPGSIDKNLFPKTVFYSSFAITTALNLFTETRITKRDYEKIFLFEKSIVYTYTLTEIVKNLVKRERPDGSDNRSFFSGHVSTTFAASTFLFMELSNSIDKWKTLEDEPFLRNTIKAAAFTTLYGWAGYVGYSRIRDKKHYISDVLTGAAVGTLISYFVYQCEFGEGDGIMNHLNLLSSGRALDVSFRLNL